MAIFGSNILLILDISIKPLKCHCIRNGIGKRFYRSRGFDKVTFIESSLEQTTEVEPAAHSQKREKERDSFCIIKPLDHLI